jgi:hypothetical protein
MSDIPTIPPYDNDYQLPQQPQQYHDYQQPQQMYPQQQVYHQPMQQHPQQNGFVQPMYVQPVLVQPVYAPPQQPSVYVGVENDGIYRTYCCIISLWCSAIGYSIASSMLGSSLEPTKLQKGKKSMFLVVLLWIVLFPFGIGQLLAYHYLGQPQKGTIMFFQRFFQWIGVFPFILVMTIIKIILIFVPVVGHVVGLLLLFVSVFLYVSLLINMVVHVVYTCIDQVKMVQRYNQGLEVGATQYADKMALLVCTYGMGKNKYACCLEEKEQFTSLYY